MQSAGRILLIPKGDYSESSTYTMLDIVNHNNASWVCKKECTGQEPSESNTEFWQIFGTAVDLSNYFPKSGGTIDGNILVSTSGSVTRAVGLKNTVREIEQLLYASDGNFAIRDITAGKNILTSSADGTNTFNGTASGNLPLTGGTVNEYLYAKIKGESGFRVYNITGVNAFVQFHGSDNAILGAIGMQGENPAFVNKDGTRTTILHTGNKPTGTYTGNGDATKRTIATGGVGHCIVVSSPKGSVLVRVGADGSYNGNAVNLSYTEAQCSNGNLMLTTTDASLNESGVTYSYEVI